MGIALALVLAACGGNGGWGVGSESGDNPSTTGPLAFGPAVSLGVDVPTNPIGANVAASIGLDGAMRVAWSQAGLPLDAGGTRRAMDVGFRTYASTTATWSGVTLAGTPLPADRADDTVVDLTTVRGAAVANPVASWLWYRQPVDERQSGRLTNLQIDAGAVSADDLPALASGARVSGLTAASNGRGTLAAAWTQRLNGLNRVFVAVRREGDVAWATPFAVQADPAIESSEPAIAVDPDGRVLSLWRDGGATAGVIRSRLLGAGGWEAVATPVIAATDAGSPAVVALGPASFVATWLQTVRGEANRSVRAARWTGTDWAVTAAPIESLPDAPDDLVLAATPTGGALSMWRQADQLWFQRLAAGTLVWSTAAVAVTGTSRNSSRAPRLAMSDSGRAVAVWTRLDSNGTGDVVYAVLESGDTNFSTPVSVRFGSLGATAPSVAAAGNNALIAWRQVIANQSNPDVMARVFAPR